MDESERTYTPTETPAEVEAKKTWQAACETLRATDFYAPEYAAAKDEVAKTKAEYVRVTKAAHPKWIVW